MAVRIRLRRMGRKKSPFYRIVAVDSRKKRDGKYLEKIGHYNPMTDPPEIVVDEEKALKWLGYGAQPSDTVRSLLSQRGIMLKWRLKKRGLSDEKITEEWKRWEVLQIEKRRRKAAKEEAGKEKEPEASPVVEEGAPEALTPEAAPEEAVSQKDEGVESAGNEEEPGEIIEGGKSEISGSGEEEENKS
ncbi:30S ribosomal protein S16 [candidate division KSB1 bacterium]|nr:30S ribosomal protein S16 [candidate division KSB1 bacterium]